jgi:hypothetical protein
VSFLEEHVISIPPYRDGRSDPLVVISSSGETTIVPMGYRVPLLWLAKVQWESLKIAVTVHCSLWDIIKLDLVYISRLTATFLAHAREAGVRAASGQIDKRWRDPMFDRVMTRFFVGWMGCRDVFVEEFYKEFKDEEYKEDVVRRSALSVDCHVNSLFLNFVQFRMGTKSRLPWHRRIYPHHKRTKGRWRCARVSLWADVGSGQFDVPFRP